MALGSRSDRISPQRDKISANGEKRFRAGIHTMDIVYKLEPDNTFQRFDFVSIGSRKIRGTRVFLPLGAHGTPPTHKLRLVRTTRPPKGDLEVVGFAFNPCPTRDELLVGFSPRQANL